MIKSGYGRYFTFTAESADEYEIMKNIKLNNHALIRFNDEKTTADLSGKYNADEYETLVKRSTPSKPVVHSVKTKNSFNRVAVVAGTVRVGDIVLGRAVTGLGKWFQPDNDDFYSVNNIAPDADYVQYVYFN